MQSTSVDYSLVSKIDILNQVPQHPCPFVDTLVCKKHTAVQMINPWDRDAPLNRTIDPWTASSIYPPNLEKPSCLHTTEASTFLQLSSHTVPQALFLHTSTLPVPVTELPCSLTDPGSHTAAEMRAVQWLCDKLCVSLPGGKHLTPASSKCAQLWLVTWVQSTRRASVPRHETSSMWIGPVPHPKVNKVANATAPIIKVYKYVGNYAVKWSVSMLS